MRNGILLFFAPVVIVFLAESVSAKTGDRAGEGAEKFVMKERRRGAAGGNSEGGSAES